MVGHCAVVYCTGKKGHKFPQDIRERKKWIMAVNRKNWKPSKNSIICHSHFKSDDYVTEGFHSGKNIFYLQ